MQHKFPDGQVADLSVRAERQCVWPFHSIPTLPALTKLLLLLLLLLLQA
jgi:hypothetical protein